LDESAVARAGLALGNHDARRSDMSDTPARILCVDDESTITDFVSYALQKEGFEADVAANGEDALEMADKKDYDLFILDIMLPGMDGYELCRRLRSKTSAPVLFLSARDTELDKVVGLEIGGDDYLSKPFGLRELIARVRALLRRGSGQMETTHTLTASGITLDEDAHTAAGDKGPIDLTPREFELMAALMKHAGNVVSREDLLRDAWGWEYLTETKTVDTHIKRLRDKIKAAGYDPAIVETVRGYGYRFRK
jgi:two-component system response regulator RegX3